MDGYESDLAYTGKHEQMPDLAASAQTTHDFWEIMIAAISWENIPDAYPFNWEGSMELKVTGLL